MELVLVVNQQKIQNTIHQIRQLANQFHQLNYSIFIVSTFIQFQRKLNNLKQFFLLDMMDERVDRSGSNGKEELKRKSRQLINKYINRAIQFVKRNRKKREANLN